MEHSFDIIMLKYTLYQWSASPPIFFQYVVCDGTWESLRILIIFYIFYFCNYLSEHAEKFGFGVVERFVGHGVGTVFHSEPIILHHCK